jgi:biotin carboxyl carrier protein
VALDGHAWVFERVDDTAGGAGGGAGSGTVTAPMPGKVVKVLVAAGDAVTAGQPLVVVEAMKMETTLAAEIDGTVKTVNANAGDTVDAGAVLVEIAPA